MVYGVSVVADAAGGWCGSVFGGGRWLVPVALSRRVCSRWCGLLVLPLVRVVHAMLWVVAGAGGAGGAGGVGAAGDCVADGVLWLLWWRGCCCCWFWACALASSGRGLVVCWFPGCGGVDCFWWRRLPLLVG